MIHLDMTGRHVEITPALRDFAEEKLAKLERLLDGPIEAHVVLGIEKHRHFAEVQQFGQSFGIFAIVLVFGSKNQLQPAWVSRPL